MGPISWKRSGLPPGPRSRLALIVPSAFRETAISLKRVDTLKRVFTERRLEI
jgi:hypothetical protein